MTTAVHFSIKYDGPALASHQMDVHELAPALLALAAMLEDSSKAAFPESEEVRVQVKGTFKSGSFGIDLIAIQSMAKQLVAMFSGTDASAAANLLQILGGLGMATGAVGGGLIGLVRWLKGRKPTAIKTEGDRVVFEVETTEVLESYTVDLIAAKLYRERTVRQSLAKVLKPLEREGVDYFAVIEAEQTAVTVITSDELQWFNLAASEADVVSDTMRENVLLQIESAVFKDDNKWRFHDGAAAFFAEIVDRSFLDRINAGDERFGKGDVLIADLRTVQSLTDNGLKQEYQIARVHQHREPLQRKLT